MGLSKTIDAVRRYGDARAKIVELELELARLRGQNLGVGYRVEIGCHMWRVVAYAGNRLTVRRLEEGEF